MWDHLSDWDLDRWLITIGATLTFLFLLAGFVVLLVPRPDRADRATRGRKVAVRNGGMARYER